MELPEIKVNHIETKSVMTKSNGPLGGYAVNPYVGCPHAYKLVADVNKENMCREGILTGWI